MRMRGCAVAAAVVLAASLAVAPAPTYAEHPAGALPPYDVACPQGDVPEDGFVDVPDSNVHEPAVDCAAWRGLVAGTGSGTYSPGAPVTRAQMATFTARLLSPRSVLPGSPPDAFDDDNGTTHEHAINQLAAVGLVTGTGARRYSPSAPVTRGRLASYLVKGYQRFFRVELPAAKDHFTDDERGVHENAVDTAASLQLVSGVGDGRYAPDAPVRRDQMARFLTAARGCTSVPTPEGQWHYAHCDAYPDTEGLSALQGFDVAVTTSQAYYTVGQPVDVRIEACNRRNSVLGQVFPQREWFVLEARHDKLPAGEFWTERSWYDHRGQPSLDGSGYGARDMHPIHGRVSDRHPRTTALTWYDGPQAGPDEVVVWQPGECKTLDVGSWQQTDKTWIEVERDDYPAHWRHRAEAPHGRTTPGVFTLTLTWGGVEVDQTRRYLTVASDPLALDGPRVTATFDELRHYEPGESVPITVSACNDSDEPYREYVDRRDVSGQVTALRASISGNFDNAGQSLGSVVADERELAWAPGECKTWPFTWGQRIGDRHRAPYEQFVLSVAWNPGSDDRLQYTSGAYTHLG